MSSDSYQLQGMAERGFLPKALASRSKHGTPTYGILLSRCAGLLTRSCANSNTPFQTNSRDLVIMTSTLCTCSLQLVHHGSLLTAVWDRASHHDSRCWLCFSSQGACECARWHGAIAGTACPPLTNLCVLFC